MLPEQDKGKNQFEIDGFKTGEIVLPGLGFVAHFKPKIHYFRYDRLVPSLSKYIASLPFDLRESLQGRDFSKQGGFNMGWILDPNVPDPQTGFLMAILNISPRANVSNEGHEAAEIMIRLGMHDQLETGLKQLGFDISIRRLQLHQVGTVGGFIAAKINGFDVSGLYRDQDPEEYKTLQGLGLI